MKKRGVVALIRSGEDILLGKKVEGDKFLSGKWHIPGETLGEWESDEAGLIRCAREEANLEIDVLRHLDSSVTKKGVLLNWYECLAFGRDIYAGSDLSEVRWVAKGEVYSFCDKESREVWPRGVNEYFGIRSFF